MISGLNNGFPIPPMYTDKNGAHNHTISDRGHPDSFKKIPLYAHQIAGTIKEGEAELAIMFYTKIRDLGINAEKEFLKGLDPDLAKEVETWLSITE